ncbi:MAG: hypothetical protein HDT28_02245, partial [Clostridiales bacterium]|nr:hypothetical protein [Clostridiales bacterium]
LFLFSQVADSWKDQGPTADQLATWKGLVSAIECRVSETDMSAWDDGTVVDLGWTWIDNPVDLETPAIANKYADYGWTAVLDDAAVAKIATALGKTADELSGTSFYMAFAGVVEDETNPDNMSEAWTPMTYYEIGVNNLYAAKSGSSVSTVTCGEAVTLGVGKDGENPTTLACAAGSAVTTITPSIEGATEGTDYSLDTSSPEAPIITFLKPGDWTITADVEWAYPPVGGTDDKWNTDVDAGPVDLSVTPGTLNLVQGSATGTLGGSSGSYTSDPTISMVENSAAGPLAITGPTVDGSAAAPNTSANMPTCTWRIGDTALPGTTGATVTPITYGGLAGGTASSVSLPAAYLNTLKAQSEPYQLVLEVNPGEVNSWGNILTKPAGEQAAQKQTFTWNILVTSPGQLSIDGTGMTGAVDTASEAPSWKITPDVQVSEGSGPVVITGPTVTGATSAANTGLTGSWTVNGTAITTGTTVPSVGVPGFTLSGASSISIPEASLQAGTNVVELTIDPGTSSAGAQPKWADVLSKGEQSGVQTFTWNVVYAQNGQLSFSQAPAIPDDSPATAASLDFSAVTEGGNEWKADSSLLWDGSDNLKIQAPLISGTTTGSTPLSVSWKITVDGKDVDLSAGFTTNNPVINSGTLTAAPFLQIPTSAIAGPSGALYKAFGDSATGTAQVTMTVTPNGTNSWLTMPDGQTASPAPNGQAGRTQTFTWTLAVAGAGELSLDPTKDSGTITGGTVSGTGANAVADWTSDVKAAINQGDSSSTINLYSPTIAGTIGQTASAAVFEWAVDGTKVTSGAVVQNVPTPPPASGSSYGPNSYSMLSLAGNSPLLSNVDAPAVIPVTLTIRPAGNSWVTLMGNTASSEQADAAQTITYNVTVNPNPLGRLTLSSSTSSGTFSGGEESGTWTSNQIVNQLATAGSFTVTGPTIDGKPLSSGVIPYAKWYINDSEVKDTTASGATFTKPGYTSFWSPSASVLTVNPSTYNGASANSVKLNTDGTPNTIKLVLNAGSQSGNDNVWASVDKTELPANTKEQTFEWTVVLSARGQLTLAETPANETAGTPGSGKFEGNSPSWTGTEVNAASSNPVNIYGPTISGTPNGGANPSFVWQVNGFTVNDKNAALSALGATVAAPTGADLQPTFSATWGANSGASGLQINVAGFNAAPAVPESAKLKTDGTLNTVTLTIIPEGSGNSANSWALVNGDVPDPATSGQTFTWDLYLTTAGQLVIAENEQSGSFTGSAPNFTGEDQTIPEGATNLTVTGPTVSGAVAGSGVNPVYTWTVTNAQGEAVTNFTASNPQNGVGTPSISIPAPESALGAGDSTVTLTIAPNPLGVALNSWTKIFGETVTDAKATQTFTWKITTETTPPASELKVSVELNEAQVFVTSLLPADLQQGMLLRSSLPTVKAPAGTALTAQVLIGDAAPVALTLEADANAEPDADGNVTYTVSGTVPPLDLSSSDQVSLTISAADAAFESTGTVAPETNVTGAVTFKYVVEMPQLAFDFGPDVPVTED